MNDDKLNILKILDRITYLLELKGENVFKINAFRKAYGTISGVEDDLYSMYENGGLAQLPGIGKGILSVIADYYSMGYSNALRELEAEVPAGLIEINSIRGLGPKKAVMLYYDYEITDLSILEAYCVSGEITKIKGFTQATADKLLENIRVYKLNKTQLRLDGASVLINQIEEVLSGISEIQLFSVTGAFRRAMEVIPKIEFVLFTEEPLRVAGILSEKLNIQDFEFDSELHFQGVYNIFFYLTLSRTDYFKRLYETTGSKEFLLKFPFPAVDGDNNYANQGKSALTTNRAVNDDNIATGGNTTLPANKVLNDNNTAAGGNTALPANKVDAEKTKPEIPSEKEIFDKIGIRYIIPEMREEQILSRLEDERFLNSDLVLSAFKGSLHFHTNYSDGANTLSEMVSAAAAIGYEYFAVCDHGKAAFQAGGMSETRVFQQKEEIDKVAEEHNVKIFRGLEADILRDGSLDFGDDFLNNFDFVVASIHSRYALDKEEMTKRILKAVENPHTDVLGHPSGRILLERPEFEADFKKIIDACRANDVAIEINASPYRLDLDWRRVYYARDKGCIFSINPDAHSTSQLLNVKYGIMAARKGGMKCSEVINCFTLEEFNNFLGRK